MLLYHIARRIRRGFGIMHAYYLDWQNQRAAYAKAVVEKHLDWSAASRRYAAD